MVRSAFPRTSRLLGSDEPRCCERPVSERLLPPVSGRAVIFGAKGKMQGRNEAVTELTGRTTALTHGLLARSRLQITDDSVSRPPKRISRQHLARRATALGAELAQMMVKVFVHKDGPLLWVEWTEERVRIAGAAHSALNSEAIDCSGKPGALAYEVKLC
jgi:PAS domain-containing protein